MKFAGYEILMRFTASLISNILSFQRIKYPNVFSIIHNKENGDNRYPTTTKKGFMAPKAIEQ